MGLKYPLEQGLFAPLDGRRGASGAGRAQCGVLLQALLLRRRIDDGARGFRRAPEDQAIQQALARAGLRARPLVAAGAATGAGTPGPSRLEPALCPCGVVGALSPPPPPG